MYTYVCAEETRIWNTFKIVFAIQIYFVFCISTEHIKMLRILYLKIKRLKAFCNSINKDWLSHTHTNIWNT